MGLNSGKKVPLQGPYSGLGLRGLIWNNDNEVIIHHSKLDLKLIKNNYIQLNLL